MASRIPTLAVVVVMAVLVTLACFIEVSDGFKLTPEKVKAIQAVKKAYASRSKRYSDFQMNAQSFCTGLCMYEDKKTYEDCYDSCAGYWDY